MTTQLGQGKGMEIFNKYIVDFAKIKWRVDYAFKTR